MSHFWAGPSSSRETSHALPNPRLAGMRPLLPDTGFLCKKRRLEQGFKAHWLETWLNPGDRLQCCTRSQHTMRWTLPTYSSDLQVPELPRDKEREAQKTQVRVHATQRGKLETPIPVFRLQGS